MAKSDRQPPPPECANCGASIPRRARACPSCGADERTGWREQSIYDGLDLPDEASPEPPRRGELAWYWWAVAVFLALLLGLTVLGLR